MLEMPKLTLVLQSSEKRMMVAHSWVMVCASVLFYTSIVQGKMFIHLLPLKIINTLTTANLLPTTIICATSLKENDTNFEVYRYLYHFLSCKILDGWKMNSGCVKTKTQKDKKNVLFLQDCSRTNNEINIIVSYMMYDTLLVQYITKILKSNKSCCALN